MYTFAPLADIPVSHGGFQVICAISLILIFVVLLNDANDFFGTFFVCSMVTLAAYGVSFHWSDQTTKTFANTQVTAEFAGYQPEGYNERSGKSRADYHYMYVVYKVNGNPVIMRGSTGIEYPKTAVLYRN